MLIRNAEVEGQARCDVRAGGGRIIEIGRELDPQGAEPCLEAEGGALIPGLHDHHIHLLALAAARDSVPCGPPDVRDRDALARVMQAATRAGGDGWLRGVGYHDSVAGPLDRHVLDRMVPARPLRVQHRSGAMWVLNSAALTRVGAVGQDLPPGVECDEGGVPNGRLFRLDGWLRERIGPVPAPDLAGVGRRLAQLGVTGVTDATPDNDAAALARFADAQQRGALPQRLLLMGAEALPEGPGESLARGALKLLLDDRALPHFDDLAARIRAAHAQQRSVAVHCVTRTQLVLAAGAFEHAGVQEGDRIEHASVAPPDAVTLLSRLSLPVVTQPGFVRDRGDQYLAEVERCDLPWLYRGRGMLEGGVALGGSTDAPFGNEDPWRAMQAAVDRRTESGAILGEGESLDPERALALFTTPPQAPGGAPRRVEVGAPADLVLLHEPWARVRERLDSDSVAVTLRAGEPIGG